MPLNIKFLDHAALRVKDLKSSATWYETVLGLKRYEREEWGPFPILLLTGVTGLALFPNKPEHNQSSDHRFIDHIAFRIDYKDWDSTLLHLNELGIQTEVQSHLPFRSIYFHDPDGHRLELMAQVAQDKDFPL